MKFRYTQCPTRVCSLIIAALCAVPSIAHTQARPYSLEQVTQLVRSGVRFTRILELARQQCISFQVTGEVERQLRSAGADAQLIAGLRSACAAAGPTATSPQRPQANPRPSAPALGAQIVTAYDVSITLNSCAPVAARVTCQLTLRSHDGDQEITIFAARYYDFHTRMFDQQGGEYRAQHVQLAKQEKRTSDGRGILVEGIPTPLRVEFADVVDNAERISLLEIGLQVGKKGSKRVQFRNVPILGSSGGTAFESGSATTTADEVSRSGVLHLSDFLSTASRRQLVGESSSGSQTWPMRVRVTVYDRTSGRFSGQVEWPTLQAIHRIEGETVEDKLVFKETEFIKRGSEALNCVYTLALVNPNSLVGSFADCGARGGTTLVLQ